jgi:hypothetical protein
MCHLVISFDRKNKTSVEKGKDKILAYCMCERCTDHDIYVKITMPAHYASVVYWLGLVILNHRKTDRYRSEVPFL